MNNTVGFVSLGCCKNLVDAERILTLLTVNGYRTAASAEEADLVVINTCGFINPSIDESFEAIQEMLDLGKRIIITGCLGKRADFIREHFPSDLICGITGPHSYDEVFSLITQILPPGRKRLICHADAPCPGIKLTPPHYAYLKISEGCSNKCTFCAIPYLRGPMISRNIADVMQEADLLLERGVRELLVVAQDTLDYGRDLNFAPGTYQGRSHETSFMALLDFLSRKDAWIRLHYLYPYPLIRKIIPYLRDTAVVPYLDIPLQHSSPSVLRRMRRPGNTERMLEEILSWKEQIPDLCIRSSFIVGFPGETEEDFLGLLDFIRNARLERVGCFPYSSVWGVQANDLPDQVPPEVRQERHDRFMEVQQEISVQLLREKIGRTLEVIADSYDQEEETLICRTRYDSPEIDGCLYISCAPEEGQSRIGTVFPAKVTGSDEYDLYGEFADQAPV